MRFFGIAAAALLFLVPVGAFAQGWFEYINREDKFSVNFSAQPEISDFSYLTATGWSVPARLYETQEGASSYNVTVINYAGSAPEDTEAAIQHVANSYRNSGGELTWDNENGVDGIDGHMVQVTNEDGGRSFVQIAFHIDLPYIVDATVPEGSIVPGHFQQSLVMLDDQGRRVRYARDDVASAFASFQEPAERPLWNSGVRVGRCNDAAAPIAAKSTRKFVLPEERPIGRAETARKAPRITSRLLSISRA